MEAITLKRLLSSELVIYVHQESKEKEKKLPVFKIYEELHGHNILCLMEITGMIALYENFLVILHSMELRV